MTKKIAEKQSNNTETVEANSSVSQLKSAIEWANDYPIQTIPVMRHLTSLLPERGFIQSFAYTEAGTITLTVQFDSAREAAYFLDNLNESKWIEESSLSSLSAAAALESTAETTGQTNTTNTTTDSTTQTNQNVTDQDSTTNSSSQTNADAGTTVEQTNTATTTTNTNTVNNSTTTSSNTTSKTESDNILPRYTGQFEIKLNKETVKKNIKKSKKKEEGVTGS
jgi:thiol:disulfide interchange protein